ncbi:membrane-spanning 4-domains subfamily A member 6D-like [Canis lupus baileyi]|uniref:Membrane spanning 4-domains A6A n=3 Tax=Canis lupus familiaris TaxID=9615 RepID=A0A8C0PCT1_CANLF|nr:membrane-spanning 4-domains subfamily A member 6D-like [Canis lupus dingo]XP_038285551.1 membrane-spanning 4-domains subfamily A member 6D [Canis lupus familiaris]XP_038312278.1 membrane-spanning 4-domains subfamily A member 6D [Canis lupus familiaris]XP_038424133.1 membrane-spanning 4-domains subfamily A member 6D [Canis lupus familiaris]
MRAQTYSLLGVCEHAAGTHGLIHRCSIGGTVISQPMASETIIVLTPNGINFPQTGKPKPTKQRQDSLEKRLKAEVKVFGTIQILCGAMLLILGIILAFAPSSPHFTAVLSVLLKTSYPFIGALCFVISGILSIVMEKRSTKPLAQSTVAANILSFLCALLGFVLLSVNLAALDPAFWNCDLDSKKEVHEHYKYYLHLMHPDIKEECFMTKGTLAGTLSVMLICTVLELCLAWLAAVVWWKQARSDFTGSVLFLPQGNKNESSIPIKAFSDPGYEKLLTS